MKIKTLLVCALAIAAFADVHAQNFSGTTTGTFGATGTNTYQGLTFNSGTFNEDASGGFAAIGNNVPGNNFGTFTLSPATFSYNSTFTLNIQFLTPAGTSPNPGIFTATVMGSVTSGAGGAAVINFLPSPRFFTFANGTFQLFVDNVNISPNGTAPITGRLVSRVPEGGATVALLGLSLVAVAAARKKFGVA